MSIIAFIIGLALPTIAGYLCLRALEWNTPVLTKIERKVMGFALGVTLCMFAVFTVHTYAGVPLTWWSFTAIEAALIAIFAGVIKLRGSTLLSSAAIAKTGPSPKWAWWIVGLVLASAVIKILGGTLVLGTTPTFYDDAMDNWNYRAKIYAHHQEILLAFPPATTTDALSSYPPPVPLFKASLTLLNGGEWNEGLVNLPHALWFIATGLVLWFLIRRRTTALWATLGAGIYWSLPLAVMHGMNPYSDLFLSLHYLAAIHLLVLALTAKTTEETASALRLAALPIALMPFVKNEGFALYLPSLLLVTGLTALLLMKKRRIQLSELVKPLSWLVGIGLVIGVSWIGYKVMHQLTFGNAKGLSTIFEGWQPGVLQAITINTFLEGNWLLLFPVLILLLIRQARAIIGTPELLVLFAAILIPYGTQLLLFLFTSLSTEALMQTGYARGIMHILPVMVALMTLLVQKTIVGKTKT